jgi:tricorn protease
MYKKNPAAQILLIIFTSIFWFIAINIAVASHSFLRYPDVHGDQLVFTSEADLWLASISTGLARRITTHEGLETNAHFSPDGRMLAFNAQYDGGTDVYVMSVEGGTPKRLTWDPSGARVIGWTPDGTNVLYLSRKSNPENQSRLWQVPVRGGLSSMLPIPRVALADMATGGKRVVYVPVSTERHNWKHYQGGRADNIWITNIAERSFKPLIVEPGIDTTPIWAGENIYFISERQELGNLFRFDPANGSVTQITNYSDAEARYPSSDGKTVVFQHGDNLALYDISADQVRELEIQINTDRIHTRVKRVPAASFLNSVAIGPTAKRVVIEARGQLVSLPVEEGANRILAQLPGSRSQYPAWSKDGKQVAFISDRTGEDQVWVVSANALGNPRQVTKDHKGPLGTIEWSPDGKYLVTADREMRILLVDTKTGAITVVDQSVRGGSYGSVNYSATFSPDGKWLAFHRNEMNSNRAVYLYNIEQQKKITLTSPMLNAFAPCWGAEGKFLYFLADRQFDPSRTRFTRFFTFEKSTKISYVMLEADAVSPFLPTNDEEAKSGEKDKEEKTASQSEPKSDLPVVKVDLVGLTDRIGELPVQADRFQSIAAVEGRLLMLVPGEAGSRERGQNSRGGNNELQAFNLKSPRKKETTTIAKNINDFQVSGDNNKLLIRKGQQYSIIDAFASSLPSDAPKVDIENISLTVNPIMEWKQIFDESWRIARDFFYAPNMHGVDWEAVRSIYVPRLENVAERGELNEILGDMIGELNTSHARVGGGDLPDGAPRVPMGYLGADYEPDAGGKAYRFIHLLKGDGFDFTNRSPLLEPGLNVQEGDYILAVDGQPVRTDEDIQALLIGTANRVISLTINSKPSMDGSRQILVTPLADERKARYYAWTESKREYVRKNGGPNLGYIHIPNMDNNGLIEFTKHYYSNLDKDGMIYDDRFNPGGYISSMLILHMARKPITWFKPRYGISWTRQSWGFAGYSVALVNENSGSNGEEFPDIFRREKLGPVIGVRTWGGEVGSGGGYRLIDGGRLNIPNYANWIDGEWIIEGTGVEPDILVEQDPKAVLEGRDPQLDRAIAHLKEQIVTKPVHRPTLPPFPVKAWRK